jgi:hypothetical protein
MKVTETYGVTVRKGVIFVWAWALLLLLLFGSTASRTTVEQLSKGMWDIHNDWNPKSVYTLGISLMATTCRENSMCQIG